MTRKLEEVWNARLQILNQQRIWSSLPVVVEIEPDGTVIERARVWGDFSQALDLREFPFDTRRIAIQVVAAGYDADDVTPVPGDESGIGAKFSVADWEILDWRMNTGAENSGPDEAQIPGVVLELNAKRLGCY